MNLSLFRSSFFLSAVLLLALNTTALFSKETSHQENSYERPSEVTTPADPQPVELPPSYQDYFTTTYLDLGVLYNDLVESTIPDLVLPPIKGTKEAVKDEQERERIANDASPKEIEAALQSRDTIFAYSYTLGKHFNPHELPKTAALFTKVDTDIRLAIYIGKRFFARPRPLHSSGFSYPSGHSTRAFLWETLLTELFPAEKDAFLTQAKAKAMNRVILGRHYPADLLAGKAYGTFLAQELLKNPTFVEEWEAVKKEIKENI